MEWYPGVDGIKTGFINASGFNIATSAVRNGRRLIGVIMGGRSAHGRDVQMASLLDQGFAALGAGQPRNPPGAAAIRHPPRWRRPPIRGVLRYRDIGAGRRAPARRGLPRVPRRTCRGPRR